MYLKRNPWYGQKKRTLSSTRAYVVITSRAKTRRDFYNETIYKSNVVSTVCFQFAVSIDISDWNRDLVDVHHLNNFKIIKKLMHSTFWKRKKLANAKDFGFEFGHRVLVSLLSIAQFPEVLAFSLFCNIIIIFNWKYLLENSWIMCDKISTLN